MKRFSKPYYYMSPSRSLLLWQLPWCYNFVVKRLYDSFVIGDFALMGQEEGKGTVRRDAAGNIYSGSGLRQYLPHVFISAN